MWLQGHRRHRSTGEAVTEVLLLLFSIIAIAVAVNELLKNKP